jgi:hypothetical protein
MEGDSRPRDVLLLYDEAGMLGAMPDGYMCMPFHQDDLVQCMPCRLAVASRERARA